MRQTANNKQTSQACSSTDAALLNRQIHLVERKKDEQNFEAATARKQEEENSQSITESHKTRQKTEERREKDEQTEDKCERERCGRRRNPG